MVNARRSALSDGLRYETCVQEEEYIAKFFFESLEFLDPRVQCPVVESKGEKTKRRMPTLPSMNHPQLA
jgi:hypothetical protein